MHMLITPRYWQLFASQQTDMLLMPPLSGALPLPFVPARVTRGTLVTRRHSFALHRCRTSQYRRIFNCAPLSVSLERS